MAFEVEHLPIVYQICGDKSDVNGPNIESDCHIANVGGYAEWAAEAGPVMEAQGYKRVFLHNPGGQFLMNNPSDPHLMLINQWQLAKCHNFSYANDRDLREMYRIFTRECGIKEIIIYLGTPGAITDPYYDGLAAIEPFMNLGPRISFAFDVLGYEQYVWPSEYHEQRALVFAHAVRSLGHRLYLEPRPAATETQWLGLCDGTCAGTTTDLQRPTQLAVSQMFGEVQRLSDNDTDDVDSVNWPTWITPIVRLWRTRHASTVMGTGV